ncbi:unnamed protein product [Peniophora sp. CBMAI 1063]|nr:unnamed protein product [Peniophora sp. CBMAI 1063]
MASPTAYLDALLTTLDDDTKDLAQGLFSSQTPKALVDLLVRLAADAPTGPPIQPNSPSFLTLYGQNWSERRDAAQAELRRLHAKRKRSATPPPTPAKRAKLLPAELPPTPAPAGPDLDDAPVYTLHALSVSAPMRKKLDITLHQRSIRLGEASFSLATLKRAFLLPTRGKSKPHWTVVLMSADQAVKPVKGAAIEGYQVVFGIDAEPTTAFASTAHPAAKETHPKGSLTRPVLLEFLRKLPIPFYEPSSNVFAPVSGAGLGIAAYRGAKEGTLWFLAGGVLGENKPCEFWALPDIDDADDAVRMISATGRTCTVFVRRKGTVEGEEEYEGEETDFGMVEGREQDGIRQWVRRYRSAFGKDATVATGSGDASGSKDAEAGANGPAPMLDDDDDDSDFGVDSDDSDGGSPTSSSDSDDEEAPGSGGEATGSDSEEEDADGGEAEEEEEDGPLDPARHPLMRAGAMPKMNKAAMDMAVGMVVDELVGGHDVEQDGEEDELDD